MVFRRTKGKNLRNMPNVKDGTVPPTPELYHADAIGARGERSVMIDFQRADGCAADIFYDSAGTQSPARFDVAQSYDCGSVFAPEYRYRSTG